MAVTLPATASLMAGDTVTISGASATTWTLAQNAGQRIDTRSLTGNMAPGQVWTPRLTPRIWHWLACDAACETIVAGEAVGGLLNTSTDGGATWTTGNSPAGIWISIDMTPTGDKIVAVSYLGGMYLSTDRGVTWRQVTSDPLVHDAAGLPFESVTISQDGQKIAAALQHGRIVVSLDGGVTWTAGTAGGVTLDNIDWRAIDSSADGSVLIAVGQDPVTYRSTDSGLTWTPIVVATGSPEKPVFENWYRTRMSADGRTMALAGNTFGGGAHTGIYISHDGGLTWTQGFALDIDYTALAMSADGQIIGATMSTLGSHAGRVVLSTNGGVSFTQLPLPAANDNWRAIAISSDGKQLAVAAGYFVDRTQGPLYTSVGDRTSVGTAGAITGGQGMAITLEYVGNGRFDVRAASGGPFAIH